MSDKLTKRDRQDIINMKLKYRNVFNGTAPIAQCREVLRHILENMYTFNNEVAPDDVEKNVLRNHGMWLIEILGSGDPDLTTDAIIDSVMKTPPTDGSGTEE